MLIFTNDDYRRIQAWLKKNAIKDSDFAISQETVPEEDILVITQNMATVPTNYRIKIKDLLNSSLGKVVIDSIIAKSIKVNKVLTVDAANVKLDNEKGTTLQDVLNYFEGNKLNRHTDDTFDGNLTIKQDLTIEGHIKSDDGLTTVEENFEVTGEITDGDGNMLSDVNSAAKGWKIEYQDPQQDEPTVRAKYVLKDYKGVPKGNVIKIYKDSAITNVYLGTTEDTCNPDTGEVTKKPIHDNNEALSIVYRLDTGKYMLVNVPLRIFTREAEFDKYRGLGIEPNGQVFVKLASDVESTNYLHFNSLGEIAADGIEARIVRDLGTLISSVAGDGTMWGQYKQEEGTQETSTPNDGSRWGEYKEAEAHRDALSNSNNIVYHEEWDDSEGPKWEDPVATEASTAYNWKTTDTPASDGKTKGNLKDLYQSTVDLDCKVAELDLKVLGIDSRTAKKNTSLVTEQSGSIPYGCISLFDGLSFDKGECYIHIDFDRNIVFGARSFIALYNNEHSKEKEIYVLDKGTSIKNVTLNFKGDSSLKEYTNISIYLALNGHEYLDIPFTCTFKNKVEGLTDKVNDASTIIHDVDLIVNGGKELSGTLDTTRLTDAATPYGNLYAIEDIALKEGTEYSVKVSSDISVEIKTMYVRLYNESGNKQIGSDFLGELGEFTFNFIADSSHVEFNRIGAYVVLSDRSSIGIQLTLAIKDVTVGLNTRVKNAEGNLSKINDKSERQKRRGQRLIGALYFDGYSGSSKARYGSEEAGTKEAWDNMLISVLPDKNMYEDWREYVKAKDGNYPPRDVSPSIYYPNAVGDPVNRGLPSVKPFWGWQRKPTTQDVYPGNNASLMKYSIEDEINIASYFGIDYFSFCFFAPEGTFDEYDNVNEEVLSHHYANEAIYGFFSAKNKWKMKACIMIENSASNVDSQRRMINLLTYLNKEFFNDSSYLYINGSPVVMVYQKIDGLTHASSHIGGCKYISMATNLEVFNEDVSDGTFDYSGFIALRTGENSYNDYVNHCVDKSIERIAIPSKEIQMYTMPLGREDRARANFKRGTAHVKKATLDELREGFKKVIELANNATEDKIINIYAWNEFCEGGWLPPVESEVTTENINIPMFDDYGTQLSTMMDIRARDKNGTLIVDPEGNALYYDFSKLQLVKEMKEYWKLK